jgi:hypothetical protein
MKTFKQYLEENNINGSLQKEEVTHMTIRNGSDGMSSADKASHKEDGMSNDIHKISK